MNDHLQAIKESIGDHGDLIAGTITNQNIIDEGEEANQLQTFDQIITALQGMTSAISSGHSDITNAVTDGLDNTKKAIEVNIEFNLFIPFKYYFRLLERTAKLVLTC